jgi:hypothetical protein
MRKARRGAPVDESAAYARLEARLHRARERRDALADELIAAQTKNRSALGLAAGFFTGVVIVTVGLITRLDRFIFWLFFAAVVAVGHLEIGAIAEFGES